MKINQEKTFSMGMKVVFAGIILVFGITGLWFYQVQEKTQRNTLEANLLSIANLKAGQIAEWRTERLADASVLMERRALIRSAQQFFINEDSREKEELIRRLHSVTERYGFYDILVVDSHLRERLTVNPKSEKQFHEEFVPDLQRAIANRSPQWTPFHLGARHPVPHLSIVAPLFDVGDGTFVGALVLVCDASQFLFPLVQSWPTISQTAETLLIRKDGDDVLFLNELRHQKDTALKLRIPLKQADLPAAKAISGITGIVEGKDYRGVEVIAAILPVSGSPWFMVSKIDAVEAFAEWRFRLIVIFVFTMGGAGFVATLVLVVRQRKLKALYRKLYRSEASLNQALERHRITLLAIGDAVISTDAEGRVELMNPVAEELTGWKHALAKGKDLTEVFPIINEYTRETVENPVSRVLKEGRVVGLANHTLLINRDGKEIPIADSGSPIRDQSGKTFGVVLVFKDQSAERDYQKAIVESEEKYRLLADNTLDVIWTMNADLAFTYVNPAIRGMTGYAPEEWVGSRLRDHCDEASFDKMAEIIAAEIAKGADHKGVVFETEMHRKDKSSVAVEIHGLVSFDESGKPAQIQGTTRDISERRTKEEAYRHLQEQLMQAQKMESVGRLAGGIAHDYNNMLNLIIGYAELALEKVTIDDALFGDLKEILGAANRSVDITRQLLAFARKQTIHLRTLDLNETLESMLKMLRRLMGEDIEILWKPGKQLWAVRMDPAQIDQILANLCVNARDAIAGVGKVTIETRNVSFDEWYCADHAGFVPGDYVMIGVSDDGKGMDKETVNMAFEPFFTTKGPGEGTGLGLSTVYGVVKQNDGFINIYSEPGEGTTVKIYLARHAGPISRVLEEKQEKPHLGRGEMVLLVEDEKQLLKLSKRMLEQLGYRVLTAGTPAEAIGLAESHDSDIQLLITDVVMPSMNGRELAVRLSEHYPELKTLFMSGYTANVIAHRGVLDDGVHFLQKPFSKRELAAKIWSVLEGIREEEAD